MNRLLYTADGETVKHVRRFPGGPAGRGPPAVAQFDAAPSTTTMTAAAPRHAPRPWSWRLRCACTASRTLTPGQRSERSRLALAAQDGSSLAERPDLIASAAEAVTARGEADADADDVLLWQKPSSPSPHEIHRSTMRPFRHSIRAIPSTGSWSRDLAGSGAASAGTCRRGRRANGCASRGCMDRTAPSAAAGVLFPRPRSRTRLAGSRHRRSDPEGYVHRRRRCSHRGDRAQPLVCEVVVQQATPSTSWWVRSPAQVTIVTI